MKLYTQQAPSPASSLVCLSLLASTMHVRNPFILPRYNLTTPNPGIVSWFSQLPKGGTRKPHYASTSLVVYRDVYAGGLCCCPHTFWTGSACGLVFCHFQTSNPFPSSRNISKPIFFYKHQPHCIRSNV